MNKLNVLNALNKKRKKVIFNNLKKKISFLLISSFLLSNLSYVTFAEDVVKYIEEQEIDYELIDDGMFYIASKETKIDEDDVNKYILKIKRSGDCEKEEKVKLTMNDMNGKYGKNYRIKVYGNTFFSEKVQNIDKAKSIVEYIKNSEYEEYNYSDAVVDGSINSENQIEENEQAEMADEDSKKLQNDFKTFIGELEANGNVNVSEENLIGENLVKGNLIEENIILEENENEKKDRIDKKNKKDKIIQIIKDDDTKEKVNTKIASLSLADGFEKITGTKNDRPKVITGNENILGNISLDSLGYMEDSISQVSNELNSAYIILDFKKGQVEKLLEIETIKDNVWTGDIQVGFNLSCVDGSRVAGSYSGFTLHIIDKDEEVPTYINFDKEEYFAKDGYIEVKVVRSGSEVSIATCMIDTEDITAKNTRDYSKVHAKIVFGFGVNERTIKIPIISDYTEEKSKFKIKLQEPEGALIGDKNIAYGIINKNDESIVESQNKKILKGKYEERQDKKQDEKILFAADYDMSDIILGDEINMEQSIYSKRNGGNSSSYQKKLNSNGWEMYLEDHSIDGGSVSSLFAARIDGGYNRFDYSGLQINWSKDQENGNVRFDYYDGKTKKWPTVYEKNREVYSNQTVNLFSPVYDTAFFELELTRYDGWWRKSPKLSINSVRPIKRMFRVSLSEAECPLLIDDNGNKVESKKIAAYKNAHNVVFDGAKSDGTFVAWSGKNVTLKLTNTTNSIFYMAGIEIVNPNNSKQAKIVVSNSNETLTQLSFKFDNNFLYYNNEYVKYVSRTGGGLNGEFILRPIVKTKKASIIVNDDDRVDVKLWENKSGMPQGYKVSGGTKYDYNLGDTIRYTAKMKSKYESVFDCNLLKLRVTKPQLPDQIDLEKRIGQNYFSRITEYSEINITPIISQSNNALVVRINKEDDNKFDKSFGFFTQKDLLVIDEGKYLNYVIDKDSKNIAGRQYEISAKTNDKTFTPVWKEIFKNDYEYTQGTYYFEGNIEKANNVIILSAKKSDIQQYSLAGTVYYEEVPLGEKTVADPWQQASGVPIMIDYAHYGISDKKGYFTTFPINGISNKYIKYKIVSNGISIYYTEKLSNAKTVTKEYEGGGGEIEPYKITVKSYENNVGHINIKNNDTTHPHITSVQSIDAMRTASSAIYINDNITTLVAYVQTNDPNTNEKYKYTYKEDDGTKKEEYENVKLVEFVVRDSRNNAEKLVIPATLSNADKTEWRAIKGFARGNYSEYKSDDKLYVRIITDRKVGDGKGYDLDGKKKIMPVFQETKYALIDTQLLFIEQAEQKPEIVDISLKTEGEVIKLPLIGDMSTMINALGMSFGIQSDGLTIRLFFGKRLTNKGSRFDGNGKATADNGIYYNLSNFTEGFDDMKDTIKSMGKKRLGTMNIGIPSWTFEPMAGVYFEFRKYYDPKAVVENRYEYMGGGGYIGCIANFRFTFYFLLVGIPCYVGGDVNISVVGEFGVAVDEEKHIALNDPSRSVLSQGFFDDIIKNAYFEHIFRAQIIGSAYAGVGLCGVLGVRGGFSITLNFICSPMAYKKYKGVRSLGFSATGAIKFWVDAVLLSVPIPVYNWPYPYRLGYFKDIYDKGLDGEKSDKSSPILKGGARLGEITSKPRDNISSTFVGDKKKNKILFGGTYEENHTKDIVNNIFDKSEPKTMIINDNKVLMVYLDDDKTRSDIERTVLKWTIYDVENDTWSVPNIIQNDNTADFNPYLCDCGDKILLTWSSRPSIVDNENDYKKVLEGMEVYVAFFDKSSSTFGEIEKLTNDKYYDYYPKAIYDKNTGDIILTYLKAEISDIKTSEDFLNAIQTEINNSFKMYMYYQKDRNAWVYDMYYANELASGEDETVLIENFKGQRFIKSTIDNGTEIINNPAISEYDVCTANIFDIDDEFSNIVNHYRGLVDDSSKEEEGKNAILTYLNSKEKSYGIYAFMVDMDHNLKTKNDSEIFVQFYDVNIHKMFNPIRITNNMVQDAMPKLVKDDENTYLMWIQNEQLIKMLPLEEMLFDIENNKGIVAGDVYISSVDKMIEGISINNYYPFITNEGQIYVVWQENSKGYNNQINKGENVDIEFAQDLYASGYFAKVEDDGNVTYAWSKSNQFTKNQKLNELPTIVSLPGKKELLMINNQYNFASDGNNYKITNSNLVETILEQKSSLEVKSVNAIPIKDETLKDGETKYNINLNIENTGLSTATGLFYSVDVNFDKTNITSFGGEWDICLAPGDGTNITENIVLTDEMKQNLDKIIITINIRETTIGDEGVTSKFNLFETEEKYEIVENSVDIIDNNKILKVEQNDDKFIIKGVVSNIGNVDGKGNEKIVVVKNGDLKESIYESDIINLKMNESRQFTIELLADDIGLENGYKNLVLYAKNDKKKISDYVLLSVAANTPYDFKVNGDDKNEITINEGDKLKLDVSYNLSNVYKNGMIVYNVDDNNIIKVNDNILEGVKEGKTNLHISTKEYGGRKDVIVTVKPKKVKPVPHYTSGGGGGGYGHILSIDEIIAKQNGMNEIFGRPNSWFYNVLTDKWYRIGEDGKMVLGWYHDIDGRWYFIDINNAMLTGLQIVNGKIYYFAERDENGKYRGEMYMNEMTPFGLFAGLDGEILFNGGKIA